MVSFPYHSHIFRDSYESGMGIVWEAYHKGVPSLGVPENPTDSSHETQPNNLWLCWTSSNPVGFWKKTSCLKKRWDFFGNFPPQKTTRLLPCLLPGVLDRLQESIQILLGKLAPTNYIILAGQIIIFTNLDFPETTGFPFLSYIYLLGWDRVRSL